MSWLPRALLLMFAMLVGAWLAARAADGQPLRLAWALGGGAGGVLLASMFEAMRGQRLMT